MTIHPFRGFVPVCLLALTIACREGAPAGAAAGAETGASAAGATAAASGEQPDVAAEYGLSGEPAWRVKLPAELHEISGLAVTDDGRVLAHGDENATVYQIDPRAGKIIKRFALAPTGSDPDLGKKGRADGTLAGDFEDIAIAGSRIFLVSSTGTILEFKEGEDGARVPYEAYPTRLRDVCEVEGLAHDSGRTSLLVLCKTMKEKSERQQVQVHEWSLDRRALGDSPRFTIPASELTSKTGGKGFNGSGIAARSGAGTLFLVAGPQRLFAEVTADGKPIRGGAFPKDAQPQPEALAFLPDGTLLVASEGGKGDATLAGYPGR